MGTTKVAATTATANPVAATATASSPVHQTDTTTACDAKATSASSSKRPCRQVSKSTALRGDYMFDDVLNMYEELNTSCWAYDVATPGANTAAAATTMPQSPVAAPHATPTFATAVPLHGDIAGVPVYGAVAATTHVSTTTATVKKPELCAAAPASQSLQVANGNSAATATETGATELAALTSDKMMHQPLSPAIVISDSQPGTSHTLPCDDIAGTYYGVGMGLQGGLDISKVDMSRLTKQRAEVKDAKEIQVNDELVNICMDMLMKRQHSSATPGQPRHFVCSSYFFPKLLRW
jgi:hypothetical protein